MNILKTFYDQNCSGKSSSRPDVIDLLKHIFTVPGVFVNKPVSSIKILTGNLKKKRKKKGYE